LSDNGYVKIDDMYAAIGYGKLAPALCWLAWFHRRLAEVEEGKASRFQQVGAAVKRALRLGEDRVSIKGVDDVLVYRARCCNPIRGEDVIGYITLGRSGGSRAPVQERGQAHGQPGASRRR
jgi:GTP pyrophosphokinase